MQLTRNKFYAKVVLKNDAIQNCSHIKIEVQSITSMLTGIYMQFCYHFETCKSYMICCLTVLTICVLLPPARF